MIKFYAYKNCDTCRKAKKWLEASGLAFEEIAIREHPPTETEIRLMGSVYGCDWRKLFNSSGQDYRAGNYKTLLEDMTADTICEVLAHQGNLVKRPFAIQGNRGRVGFSEADWAEYWKA